MKTAYNMQCHIFQISDTIFWLYQLDFLNLAFWLCLWDIHLPSSFCLPKKTFCSMTWSVSYCLVHLGSFRDWVLINSRKLCRVPFSLPVTITRHICMWCSAGQWDTGGSLERLPCSLKGTHEKGSPSVPLGITMSGNDFQNWLSRLATLSGTSLKRMGEQEDWKSISPLNPSSSGAG